MSTTAFNWRTTHILGPVVNNIYSRSPVNALQVRDDRLLVGFSDSTVRLFDRASGIRMWTLEGHGGPVNCLHSSKTRMVTGSDDKMIKVWDMREGRCLLTLEGHIAPVLCVRLSDRHILSGGRDHTIKVWDKSTGYCLRTLRGHTGRIVDLQLGAGSGSQFYTSSTDGTIKLWDVRSENRIRSYKGHKKAIVSFHHEEATLISAADDGTIKSWDCATGKCSLTLRVGSEREIPQSIRIRNDLLFCGEASGTIRIREASTGTPVRLLEGHASRVAALQVEDFEIWSGSSDSTVRRWSTEDEVRILLERMKTEEFEVVDNSVLSSNTFTGDLTSPGPASPSGGAPSGGAPSSAATSSVAPSAVDAGSSSCRDSGSLAAVTVPSSSMTPLASGLSTTSFSAAGPGSPGGVLAPDGPPGPAVTLSSALQGTTVEPAWAVGEFVVTDLASGDSPILCCALSRDYIVYGTEDGQIVIADRGSPSSRRTKMWTSPIRAIFVAAIGVGSGADDGSVALWSSGSGTAVWSVQHHIGAVNALQTNGKFVASGSQDGSLKVMNAADGILVHSLTDHSGPVTTLHFLATTIVSGAADGSLAIWNATSGEVVKVLSGHKGAVTALEFDDLEVLSASEDGTIRVWDVATGECVRMYSLGEGEARINCLQFDDSKIVHGLANGNLVVRDMETGESVRVLTRHSESVTDLAYDANVIVSASRDASLRMWTFTGAPADSGGLARSDIADKVEARMGEIMARAGPSSGKPGDSLRAGASGTTYSPGTSPGGGGTPSSLAVNSTSKHLELSELAEWSRAECKKRTINRGKNTAINCLHFTGDSLVTGGSDGVAKMWDINTGSRLKTFRGHLGAVNCLRFSGDTLVSGDDLHVRVWSMASNSCVVTLDGHEGPVLSLGFNSEVIVSGSRDHTLKVWDLETGRLLRTLKGHNGRITDLVLRDQMIVSASTDGTLKLWDINTSQRVRSFKGHTQGVNCCSVVSTSIVSGSADASLRVWDLGSGSTISVFDPSGANDVTHCLQADEHKIICGRRDGVLAVRTLIDGSVVRTWDAHTRAINAVQFDETRIVSGSEDKTAKVIEFDDKSGKNKSCVIS
ncbi:NB-ARC domain-containing protein [Thecamonas trahens ATCC 50062]|uniref:NB-ARC domain-containing protein n=1 Tax=Thecamonas trahens ATCC 50062 TaxID=461836 RepID=A0A0L0DKD5_THETB|nr:NB-ARC domain-containing protein [Thecamonas trahens ATCC 50062]KNC52747.1 NB-ARC domain-containing protein [Thecamonas trahens ATCC 50062]|eukprot:XP_013755060.1 NB-ARC domain-containing protein [Thecamonas trahens ATCC 50062]